MSCIIHWTFARTEKPGFRVFSGGAGGHFPANVTAGLVRAGAFWPNTDATPIIRWLSWASFHGVEPVTDPDTKRWLLLYDIYVRQAAQQPLNAPQTSGNATFKM